MPSDTNIPKARWNLMKNNQATGEGYKQGSLNENHAHLHLSIYLTQQLQVIISE